MTGMNAMQYGMGGAGGPGEGKALPKDQQRHPTPFRIASALAMAGLLVACATVATVVDPPLAQLDRWNRAPAAEIIAEPVVTPCPAENPACARLHTRRAEACVAAAMALRATRAACPGLAARTLLECAAEGYRAAPRSPAFAANQAQALTCLAHLSAPATRAALAAEALTAARAVPGGRAAEFVARAQEAAIVQGER